MLAVDKLISQAKSWDDFFAVVSALPDRAADGAPDKGNVFERLTQCYLETTPEYRSKLKNVWRAKEVPDAVRAKLRLPSTDEGIDLVAETRAGEFWAVQCKLRTNTEQALRVADLATFTNLTFNYCKGFSLAVVAHTCAKPVRKQKLLGRATEIGLERWLDLDAQAWSAIHQVVKHEALKPPAPRHPRAHQVAAVAEARRHFVQGNATRGRMFMPCGTGKSLTAYWIARELQAKSIIVAVPSLVLINKSLRDWTQEFLADGETPDWLCVCSDETTGYLGEADAFVRDVYDVGVDTTTDETQIVSFLRSERSSKKVVFVTYQSGAVLGKAARKAGVVFDLAIMDEAHRTVGASDKAFAHLLADKNIAIRHRVFMTATERVVRGVDDDVVSMDDPAMFGDCFFQLSFKQAIEADPPIISDYPIVTLLVTDDEVRQLIEENRYLDTSERLGPREAQTLAAGLALRKTFEAHEVRHAISFHRSIKAAKDFLTQHEVLVEAAPEDRRPRCFHVSSRETAGKRVELLRHFGDASCALITNARCLQEGVDIPAVDCVLFADPKQSVVDIVQAAGRAMRPYPGKQYGYIVVPIIVPSDATRDEFAESTEFKQVARVISALSTQDGRIAEELRAVTAKPRRGGGIVEIAGSVPVGLNLSLEQLAQQINTKLWERVAKANWRPFEEAREWARGLGLKSGAEWSALYKNRKLPEDIPTNPNRYYRHDGWAGMGDWLGTGRVANRRRKFRAFAEAREWARGLGLESWAEWRTFAKSGRLPTDIPASPPRTYGDQGWVSWGDWLGTETTATRERRYRPFAEAREWVRGLGLKSAAEWRALCQSGKVPKDIQTNPNTQYRDQGWVSWGDWLGTGRARRKRNGTS